MKRQNTLPKSWMAPVTEDSTGYSFVGPCEKLAPKTPVGSNAQQQHARQTRSDMRWEGPSFVAFEDGRRRKRKRDQVSAPAQAQGQAQVPPSIVSPSSSIPPRPKSPDPVIDCSSRRKDKDVIPSPQTWFWDDVGKEWVLQARPRVLQCGKFFSYLPIPTKQVDLLHHMMDDVVSPLDEEFLRKELVPRLNRTHPVSLRTLDWLVVDYAREKGTAYRKFVPSLKRRTIVVMHVLYASWLHRWKRRHFDPFRRRHRIFFELDGETYSTTVAQLHFFYMAQMFGFLEYAELHLEDILQHMREKLDNMSDAKDEAKNRGETYARKPLVGKACPRAFVSEGTFDFFAEDGDADPDPIQTHNTRIQHQHVDHLFND